MFEVTIRREVDIISATRDLGADDSHALHQLFCSATEAGVNSLILDLTRIDTAYSLGGTLIGAGMRCSDNSGKFVIAAKPGSYLREKMLSVLTKHGVIFCDSVKGALSVVAQAAA